MSFIGWLDYSEDEQRRVRELLQMFRDRGTVDDLGIGTLRDAISNRLFPGTSVLQTRARYFLFVPWIFQHVADRRGDVLERAEFLERKLIGALQRSDDQEGLIGRQAGMDVRTLPSAIYWAGLVTYGIFRAAGLSRARYARSARSVRSRPTTEEELAERTDGFWDPDLPPPPDDFFDFDYADFALRPVEAVWLSERVLSRELEQGPCLLGDHVRQVRSGGRSLPEQLWEGEPLPGTAPETRRLIHHAERFSLLVEGAAIVYNLMLHEQRDDPDRGDAEDAEALRARLDAWAGTAGECDLAGWTEEREEFFQLVDPTGRTPFPTRTFIQGALDRIATRPLDRLADDAEFRALVRNRELQHKRNLARFRGGPRLQSWQGGSGLRRLDFRWNQIRRFLDDLRAGLAADRAPTRHADAAY
ncbi:MAG: DUF6361 family protein [Pseudomonadales bacterium]|jgi:hypothetical protein|nr:DUF6361 family protein [Pseudomonadales bacterium]